MKVLVKSAWAPDDPTKAAFPFLHSNALADAYSRFKRDCPCWMAAPGGDFAGNDRAANTDPRLRRLLAGPWGP